MNGPGRTTDGPEPGSDDGWRSADELAASGRRVATIWSGAAFGVLVIDTETVIDRDTGEVIQQRKIGPDSREQMAARLRAALTLRSLLPAERAAMAIYARTQDDALAILKAERDENTCRKAMTWSELVAIGEQIEAIEVPKAAARQTEGQERGRQNRFGSGSREPEPQEPRTRKTVAEALGVSEASYQRAKTVIGAAESDPGPDVREVAKRAVEDLDQGKTSPKAASAA